MLRPVEAAHARPILHPAAELHERTEHLLKRPLQDAQASPVDEDVDQRTGAQDRCQRLGKGEEQQEHFVGRNARPFHELAVLALGRDEPVDLASERRVGERGCRCVSPHRAGNIGSLRGIAHRHPMLTGLPHRAKLGDRRWLPWRDLIGTTSGNLVGHTENLIEFAVREPYRSVAEILDPVLELAEPDLECSRIPFTARQEPVDRDRVLLLFELRQACMTHHQQSLDSELARGFDKNSANKDLQFVIYDDREGDTRRGILKHPDGTLNIRFGIAPRIAWCRPQRGYRDFFEPRTVVAER